MVSYSNELIEKWANDFVCSIEKELYSLAQKRTEGVFFKLEKVLNIFSEVGLASQHFCSSTGYAHDDLGRDIIDKIYAKIFGSEKAAVRMQFVSGTHAIASCLFGSLRPGDNLLSVTGEPYETLREVIGKTNTDHGSLIDFGVQYDELSIFEDEKLNFEILESALQIPRRMIFIQRSCGYSWRPSLSIRDIKDICNLIHIRQPNCICFVDNCYGEFVEEKEPTHVGADLIAGSLIKNPGGTIVPAGGYVAGNAELVEKACCRLTAPGIGSKGGTGFDLNRQVLQGLFLSPQMVSESLIGADLVAGVFHRLGFDVKPLPGKHRGDLIQAVRLEKPEVLVEVCRSFQLSSPVGSFLNPIPSSSPGYAIDLIMSGGTFIDGSTSEFSADAPFKKPYNLYVQGGTHRSHIKFALIRVLVALVQAGFLDLSQTSS